ncbi:cell envelope integrity protein TolA [Acinetobacter gyllenbergii]|uniref:cell envelope integrity protein TolA n=1 Tax=Acinetobacter gyllenbergii TaxID=134534 RepID=UPI000806C892|nr:cell envelope integrity protein TolA [Acinetobacter gyllenbergii]
MKTKLKINVIGLVGMLLVGNVYCAEIISTSMIPPKNSKFLNSNIEAERYKEKYIQKIIAAWVEPENDGKTGAIAKITLNDKGEIENYEISSIKNKDFELSIVNAIKKAAPFSLPEDKEVRNKVKHLIVTFYGVDGIFQDSKLRDIEAADIIWIKQPNINISSSDLEGQERYLLVSIEASERGVINKVSIIRSTGSMQLDQKVVREIKLARLSPYKENGVGYPFSVTLPLRFLP